MIIRSDYVFSNGENEHEQFTKFNVSALANDQDEAGVDIQASTNNNGEAAASIAVVECELLLLHDGIVYDPLLIHNFNYSSNAFSQVY